MRTNFHTHYSRCRHAGGSAEDYVRAAIKAHLSQLGFSDHAPFPEFDFGMRMPFGELQDYVNDIEILIKKYKDEIIVRKGLEIEYLPKYRDYYEELLHKWGIEYLLLGEHFYKNSFGQTANIFESPSTEQYIHYARTAAEGMKSGFFKIFAHPDIYMINSVGWDENCKKAADIIIDAAVAAGTILEYNANGIRRGLQEYPDGIRYPYPHDAFWQMAAAAPVKVIVGSDCHGPEQVWDQSVVLAHDKLHRFGIAPVTELI